MNQPCTRCGGSAVKDGANTEYGRVCQTCYQGYFKAKKECFECGEFKRDISRYSKLSHDHAVCTSCYQSHFMQSCPLCYRYRELVDSDKGPMCQKCHDFGDIPCESCHKLMPAGMGRRCNDCYWSQRLKHEAKVNSYLLSTILMRQAYIDFTEWFMINKGSMTATLKHNNYIDFFVRCDELWSKIPSYESLVNEFKPNGLREHLTVLRWLIKTKQVVVDTKIKEQIAEEERIINLLAKFDGKAPRCINDYHQYLEQKLLNGKTSLKSIRLALQPAIDLCTQYSIETSNTPNQEQIEGYLLVKHGQYSALYGFAMFLNREYGLGLVCMKPSKDAVLKAKKGEIERQLMLLYNQPQPLSDKDELLWLQLGMAYFHKINIQLKALKTLTIQPCNEEMSKIIFNDKEYWLPKI
ncbi:hypothetical protein [Psychrobacter immobilis]|uniref:hypothetical protein n=1 Tax=Psychrobacter immobilis TaxID=498 RepID=UPI001D11E952|nr:hypothetical protein [Psychrobacter immobilis]